MPTQRKIEPTLSTLRSITVTFVDGNKTSTSINGTKEEIERYYLAPGRVFNLGEGDKDNVQRAVNVEFHDAVIRLTPREAGKLVQYVQEKREDVSYTTTPDVEEAQRFGTEKEVDHCLGGMPAWMALQYEIAVVAAPPGRRLPCWVQPKPVSV
jgi:hypothetical protein